MRGARYGPLLPALLLAASCVGLRPPAPGPPVGPIDVQGHRGARGLLPENSLPAFERALDLGVSTLEMDLVLTREGIPVVSHDPYINPALCLGPDGAPISGTRGPLIRDLELSELRGYDCGSLNPDRRRFPEPPRRQIPGTPIPTLEEVFDLAESRRERRVRFNLEIKTDPTEDTGAPLPDLVRRVLETVRDRGLAARVTIQSFDWRALEIAREIEPAIRTSALLSPRTVKRQGGAPSPWLNGLDLEESGGTSLGLLHAASAYVDVFSPYWRQVLPGAVGYLGSRVGEIRTAGFPVIPWTANRPRHMQRLLHQGVDGLITDYPDRLLELLRERGTPIL